VLGKKNIAFAFFFHRRHLFIILPQILNQINPHKILVIGHRLLELHQKAVILIFLRCFPHILKKLIIQQKINNTILVIIVI
tara:strand:+ start:1260 stop:1502 length:243 start_codon:yes stop_codon:yes gene_type:complete